MGRAGGFVRRVSVGGGGGRGCGRGVQFWFLLGSPTFASLDLWGWTGQAFLFGRRGLGFRFCGLDSGIR